MSNSTYCIFDVTVYDQLHYLSAMISSLRQVQTKARTCLSAYQFIVGSFGQSSVLLSMSPQTSDGVSDGVDLQLVQVQLLHRRVDVRRLLELVVVEGLLQRRHRRVNRIEVAKVAQHVAVAAELLLVPVQEVEEVLPLVQDLLPDDLDLRLSVIVFAVEVGDHLLDVLEPVLPGHDVRRDGLVLLHTGPDLVQVRPVPGVRQHLQNQAN